MVNSKTWDGWEWTHGVALIALANVSCCLADVLCQFRRLPVAASHQMYAGNTSSRHSTRLLIPPLQLRSTRSGQRWNGSRHNGS